MFFTDLLSHVFNLPLFTGAIVLTALLLLLARTLSKKKPLYNLFTGLGMGAILTQWSYVNAPQRIYSNAGHHVIEHLGFSFDQRLVLANEGQPNQAIWDTKKGQFLIEGQPDGSFLLEGREFMEPLFVEKGDRFQLANPVFSTPIRQRLTIRFSDSLDVALDVKPYTSPKDPERYTISARIGGQAFGPLPVRQTNLVSGYSVGGLIAETQLDVPNLETLVAVFDSTWLVRAQYRTDKALPVADVPLLFFPSQELLSQVQSVIIDGRPITVPDTIRCRTRIQNDSGHRQRFYCGLWTTHTPIYQLERKDNRTGRSEWTTTFPDRKYLKKLDQPDESLFVTSSTNDIATTEQPGGFHYPLFRSDTNRHHFFASLAYHEGHTRQRMGFRVISTDRIDLDTKHIDHYQTGDTIRIAGIGALKGDQTTHWLFRITDLKAANPLQPWHLLTFTVVLITLIFGSIYLTPGDRLVKTEILCYLTLLAFLTVRSVLLWRTATFLPVEDVSAKVYGSLSSLGWQYFIWGGVATLGFFAIVWVWKWQGLTILTLGRKFTSWLSGYALARWPTGTNGLSGWFFGWFLLYGLAYATKILSTRIGAVYSPLLVYFLTQFYLLHRQQRTKLPEERAKIRLLFGVNWVICFAYIVVSDAGFSIVFLLFSLLYHAIKVLTFPDYPTQYRHLWALLPIGALIGLIAFAPYLLSFVFRHPAVPLASVGALLVGLAAYLAFRRPVVWLGQPRFLPVGLGVILLIVAFGCFSQPESFRQLLDRKSYIRYRSEVLVARPDEILQREQFKYSLGNDSKLLRAAQNQWLINYYYDKSDFNPRQYFQIQPSFQQGSPYLTQISDLVTVRYVIGEHSHLTVLLLLLLLLLLVGSALQSDIRFNLYSRLRVQGLCLLFMIGFFIWMAATNRMVFLGQDFPLLSMNSILTLLVTFSVLAMAVIFGERANAQPRSVVFNRFGRKLMLWTFGGTLLFGILVLYGRMFQFDSLRFNLKPTVDQLQQSFSRLNERFAYFQREANHPAGEAPASIQSLINAFDASLGADKDSLFKSPFARSAYEAYRTTLVAQNSIDNLIHLRQGSDSLYEFSVNSLYYNIYSPDNFLNGWRGSLLGTGNPRPDFLQNRASKVTYALRDASATNRFNQLTLSQSMPELRQHQNLRLTVIPNTWTVDSLPAVIVSRTSGNQPETRSQFLIKSGTDLFHSSTVHHAMLLKPGDVLQFVPADKQEAVSLQYQSQSGHYLAKNVWLNGRYQFFYPLREKFLWSHHFANLLKSRFDRQPDDAPGDVRLTIDYELTETIYRQAETYFRKTKWGKPSQPDPAEKARAFNLVVLDDEGNIRALCDYKKGARIKIDPNRMREYQPLMASNYLNGRTSEERLLFANRCLTRMDNGPASTFKPILYGAVTSQYNFDWPGLSFGGAGLDTLAAVARQKSLSLAPDKNITLHYYGGRRVKFVVEGPMLTSHSNYRYLSHSTNTYNSEIVFLGSLDKPQLETLHRYIINGQGKPTYLAQGSSADVRFNFPYFDIWGVRYRINQFPKSWSNYNSVLATGLWENFSLPVRQEQTSGINGQQLLNVASSLDSVDFNQSYNPHKIWCFPEPSHLYLVDRTNTHNAIVQVATGADPISVTPLKMAEMAGVLFSFNRSYQAHVVANAPATYNPLVVDRTWQGAQRLTSFYSQNLFRGMNGALTLDQDGATGQGTAHNLVGEWVMKNYPQYHFYAKTGTISGNRFGSKRDKHLLLVISKDKLHNRPDLTPDDLRHNRFYVLYFSFYKQSNNANWGDAAQALQSMVRTVLESPQFKSYMQ
ncbi:MAG: hypothetical protein H7Z72_21850 [Bacteroidetes bacterium]|nr:hypothetical protein [Fibrella sp.]